MFFTPQLLLEIELWLETKPEKLPPATAWGNLRSVYSLSDALGFFRLRMHTGLPLKSNLLSSLWKKHLVTCVLFKVLFPVRGEGANKLLDTMDESCFCTQLIYLPWQCMSSEHFLGPSVLMKNFTIQCFCKTPFSFGEKFTPAFGLLFSFLSHYLFFNLCFSTSIWSNRLYQRLPLMASLSLNIPWLNNFCQTSCLSVANHAQTRAMMWYI